MIIPLGPDMVYMSLLCVSCGRCQRAGSHFFSPVASVHNFHLKNQLKEIFESIFYYVLYEMRVSVRITVILSCLHIFNVPFI